jgi:hypothetical protein
VSLHAWFYAIYRLDSSRDYLRAKDFQRMFAVTYKTAWRMSRQIREAIATPNGQIMLRGLVYPTQRLS